MDDVRVHYNSNKPATVQALAYTQGTDIHVAPGQEKHLPHEAWHVAQQMAGRVSPTTNINGMPVNDNAALEHEADVMGEKAVTQKFEKTLQKKNVSAINVQCTFTPRYHREMVYNDILDSVRKEDDYKLPKESYNLHILDDLMQLLQNLSKPITTGNWRDVPGANDLFNKLCASADKDRIKLKGPEKEHSQETVAGEINASPVVNESEPAITPVDQEMDKEKIESLKGCPREFTNITLYHGDDRDYLLDVGISPCNTEKWGEEFLRTEILKRRSDDAETQEDTVNKVLKLSEPDFDEYINQWVHNAGEGSYSELCKPFSRGLNGWCCCMIKSKTKGMFTYEITLNDSFTLIQSGVKEKRNRLYIGTQTGIILQFAEVNSDQGEVDILSTIDVDPTTNPNVRQSKDKTVILTKL